ncbi:uncharacterized protein LOC120194654 [Hibiscus syriacus]|uniref:uncharacterized protein LOC120194654 n=1 Tax=Hibiscus syriacus TaxID=106335 RepID=UPI001921CB0C|nr:uncharacterized protein LOC120194654 [Hibiscus syriacus]
MEEEYEGEAPVQPSKPRGRHIKKRATKNKALSVSFNEKDLRDYVTGFHKRKKKRRKEAQKKQEQAERRKKVLSIWEIKGKPSPLSKRHCLVLDTEICEWDIPGIVSLLQSSPYLKKLVINLYYCDNSKERSLLLFLRIY